MQPELVNEENTSQIAGQPASRWLSQSLHIHSGVHLGTSPISFTLSALSISQSPPALSIHFVFLRPCGRLAQESMSPSSGQKSVACDVTSDRRVEEDSETIRGYKTGARRITRAKKKRGINNKPPSLLPRLHLSCTTWPSTNCQSS